MSGLSISDPVTLQVALTSGRIIPGDTILICPGTYTGNFTSTIIGSAALPITIKPHPGAEVTIDGKLSINGPYTRWENMRFTTSSWISRTTDISGSEPDDMPFNDGVSINAAGVQFINNIVHNNSTLWAGYEAVAAEVYGNILFNNGWSGPDRGHVHGLYTQNLDTRKIVKDNIAFQNFSTGLKFYGGSGYCNNYDIIGNICFNNGILYDRGMGDAGAHVNWNFLIGSWTPTSVGVIIRNNKSYWVNPVPEGMIGSNSNNLCSGSGDVAPPTGGLDSPIFEDNYFAGEDADFIGTNRGPLITPQVLGNTFIGNVPDDIIYSGNNYFSNPYSVNAVFVSVNDYNAERVHVAIYNWEGLNSVVIDLTSIASLSVGDHVNVTNVQDLFTDITELVLDANKCITVDMRAISHTVAAPILWDAPPTTFPTFGCFIIELV